MPKVIADKKSNSWKLASTEYWDACTVAENLIKKYGKKGFHRLIELFQQGQNASYIAELFDVSRQRVWQWKRTLGHERILYVPNKKIKHLLNEERHAIILTSPDDSSE